MGKRDLDKSKNDLLGKADSRKRSETKDQITDQTTFETVQGIGKGGEGWFVGLEKCSYEGKKQPPKKKKKQEW